MQRGDIIKLGRIKFAVKEIQIIEETMEVDEGNNAKIQRHANFEAINDEEFFEFKEVESHYNLADEEASVQSLGAKSTPTGSTNGDEIPSCRFCWLTKTEQDNPLINSCKCSGSVRFIHLLCLMKWLNNNKKNVKNGDNYISYFWKTFECELCRTAYPLMVKSDGKNFHLVNYERPTTSYLVLESLN